MSRKSTRAAEDLTDLTIALKGLVGTIKDKHENDQPINNTKISVQSFKPEKYNGTESPQVWLSKFKSFVYLSRYDDLTLIQHALRLLIPDTDLSWFESLDVTSIDELYDSFLTHFHTKQPSWLLEQTLWNRQMTNHEDLETYISDIQLLSDRLGKTEKEKMSAFVRGLPSNIRTVIVQKDPCSWDETCKCARLAQEALKITHPTERKVSTDIHAILESQNKTINELAKVVMQVQEKSRQSTINTCAANASRRDPIVCQYCDRPNHTAKECTRIPRQRRNEGPRYGTRLKKCDICKKNGHIARDCWHREKYLN